MNAWGYQNYQQSYFAAALIANDRYFQEIS